MPLSAGRPVFIVSSPRSGSTLLRLILDAHPRLAVPPPAWLFHYIYPYLYSYGDLGVGENLRALVQDVLDTPTVGEWPIKPGAEEVVEELREPSFAGVCEALHRMYARASGKERWGEKSPKDCYWMQEIRACFPDAQFVHILRDGRDVAIDISDSSLWPNTLYGCALLWQDYVRAVAEDAKGLGPGSFYEVRYEDLCAEPERVLRGLCAFLGEDFVPEMLAHHRTESTRAWSKSPVHAKTARPITADYVGMYGKRLPPRDRAALEAAIGETLRASGYPAGGTPEPLPPRLARQLLENDTITNVAAIQYRRQHEARRRERRERGVWRDADRDSLLWGFV